MIQEFCSPNWRFGRKFQSAPGGTAAAWMAESPHGLLVGRLRKGSCRGACQWPLAGRFGPISGHIRRYRDFWPVPTLVPAVAFV